MYRRGKILWACSAFALAVAAEAAETTTYTYDAQGRLTATTTEGGVNNGVATGIAYDPAGNRSNYNLTGASAPPSQAVPAPPSSSPSQFLPPPPPPPPSGSQLPTATPDSASGMACPLSGITITSGQC